MKPTVDQIWRFPVKSLGAESILEIELEKDRTLCGDRIWALTYENSRFDQNNPTWFPCHVFLRCSIAPLFAAVTVKTNIQAGYLVFSHPMLEDITLNLEEEYDREKFIDWVLPICPGSAPKPKALCRVPGRGMTDTDYPSISLNSISSLIDLSERVGAELNPVRFRGNLWIRDLVPWSELQLIGKKIKIGDSTLEVVEPIVRCNTTKTNEKTGVRDVNTLEELQSSFGHRNFGVYCKVVSTGQIATGDVFEVLKK